MSTLLRCAIQSNGHYLQDSRVPRSLLPPRNLVGWQGKTREEETADVASLNKMQCFVAGRPVCGTGP